MRTVTAIAGLLIVSTWISAQELEPPPPIEEQAAPQFGSDLSSGSGMESTFGNEKKAGAGDIAVADSPFYPQVVLQRLPPVKGTADTMADLYGDAQLVDQSNIDNSTFTTRALATLDLLPAPEDGNDIFYSQLSAGDQRLHLGTQPLGYGYFLGGDETQLKNVWTRIKAQPHFGFYYDTGFVGPSFNVANIELGDPIAGGQTKFFGDPDQMLTPVILMGDAQLSDPNSQGPQLQLLVEANNHQVANQLDVRSLFVRAWDRGDLSVSAGKGYSLYEVGGALPATLTQAGRLVGSGEINDDNKPIQIRLQRSAPKGNWGWGVGLEDPETPDFTQPSGAKLTRWPTAAAQVAYNGEDGVDRIQFAALTRTLGFESDPGRQEFFTTGWGLSAYALLGRQMSDSEQDGFYVGAAGGEAVGQYIQGISRAAVFDGADLTSLSAFGAYAGYKRQWETCSGVAYGVNAAYGYAIMEDEPTFANTVNQELQQAWANFVILPSNNTAVGVEYQFGRRETHANADGENHRFLFMVAFTTSAKKGATGAAADSAGLGVSTPVDGTAALQRF